ncbi:MAG TPA: starch-binding protein [Rhodospirillales bacterium]|nr:starch-binding protein [Rhodospirillales bacterium]
MFITYFWVDSWLKLMAACAEQMQPLAADDDVRTALVDELEQVRASLADSEAALATMDRQRGELQAKLEQQQRQAEAERADHARAQQAGAADAEARLRQETAARAAAQSEIETLRRKLTAAQTEAATARAEAQRRQEENAAIRAEAEESLGRTSALAERMREEARELRKELDATAAETAAVRRENQQLAKEVAAYIRDSERMAAELGALKVQIVNAIAAAEAAEKLAAAEPAAAAPAAIAIAPDAEVRKPAKRTRKQAAASAETVPPADLALRFRKPDGWAEPVYVHYWETDPAAAEPAWPGTAMANAGDGWWQHRIDGVRAASLVFNDNAGNQTANLRRNRPGSLGADGTWTED